MPLSPVAPQGLGRLADVQLYKSAMLGLSTAPFKDSFAVYSPQMNVNEVPATPLSTATSLREAIDAAMLHFSHEYGEPRSGELAVLQAADGAWWAAESHTQHGRSTWVGTYPKYRSFYLGTIDYAGPLGGSARIKSAEITPRSPDLRALISGNYGVLIPPGSVGTAFQRQPLEQVLDAAARA